ncbi:unnamed protein product [Sphenostylis stenocarpa]|uniref:Disease resistance RPP13-like protein 1 n=1 Tax=Sphenostylis stenocarpa TaxID=92480 RepID=A0AA86W3N9_9FABA|nr:unnamed protein product [Sphenostylis stenocarpa]
MTSYCLAMKSRIEEKPSLTKYSLITFFSETLGGALFSAVLQMLFDRVDSRQVLDYFCGRKLDEKLLRKLKRKLVSIKAVVDDAEQKQFRNACVRAWLHEVRDVLLDTEDLLDEIDSNSPGVSWKLNPIRIGLARSLDDQESLINQKDDLGLKSADRVGIGLDEFDVLTVTKAIIGEITKSKDDSEDLQMVQGRLKEKLIGRKFLVVLDDVWNEGRQKWKTFQTPLNYGAKGSKILVTTRSMKVASIVQSSEEHELKQLGGDHSWQVFAKHAFQDDNPQMSAELKEIGTKIVEKCKGLPLALETVGSLLRSKSSVSEWKSILRSEIWEFPEEDSKIIPALLLSYYHLPSHLKRCFSYCAIFPKDHKVSLQKKLMDSTLMIYYQGPSFNDPAEATNRLEVPDTIGDLIHLRSLNLSRTAIKNLPHSRCSLYNLETLRLNYCLNLKEMPSDLHKLTNLHHLELTGNSLTKVPIYMGKMMNLQILMTPFNVGISSELHIQQLGELSLHGEILIKDLQNTVNPLDALAADLKNKALLVQLNLQWDSKRSLDNSMKERDVLENLQPSKHLKQLSINEYGGTQFPLWLSDNSLSNVVSLTLKNCKHCLWLPSLGLLIFLKHLEIMGLDCMARIDADFYGNSSSSSFPKSSKSCCEEMSQAERHLPEQLSHLKELLVEDCKQLTTLAPRTPEICELHLRACGKLQIDHHSTTLKRLEIEGENMEASLLERLGHIISHNPL